MSVWGHLTKEVIVVSCSMEESLIDIKSLLSVRFQEDHRDSDPGGGELREKCHHVLLHRRAKAHHW